MEPHTVKSLIIKVYSTQFCVWVGQAVERLMPEAKGLRFESFAAGPLNLNSFTRKKLKILPYEAKSLLFLVGFNSYHV